MWNYNRLIYLGPVIRWSNMTRYCIQIYVYFIYTSEFELKKDTPYIIFTVEQWSICCEYFAEKWPDHDKPLAQIPWCTSLVSHNAPFCNRNVHLSVTKWCIIGYLSSALWDLWDGSIGWQKCHFNEIFIAGCAGSCHFNNFLCSQW